jgi:hypothetical protein
MVDLTAFERYSDCSAAMGADARGSLGGEPGCRFARFERGTRSAVPRSTAPIANAVNQSAAALYSDQTSPAGAS